MLHPGTSTNLSQAPFPVPSICALDPRPNAPYLPYFGFKFPPKRAGQFSPPCRLPRPRRTGPRRRWSCRRWRPSPSPPPPPAQPRRTARSLSPRPQREGASRPCSHAQRACQACAKRVRQNAAACVREPRPLQLPGCPPTLGHQGFKAPGVPPTHSTSEFDEICWSATHRLSRAHAVASCWFSSSDL